VAFFVHTGGRDAGSAPQRSEGPEGVAHRRWDMKSCPRYKEIKGF